MSTAPVIGVQRRMMQLGRIRLGDKKGSGRDPRRKLSKFRLTSASRSLLDAAAEIYGGDVQEWTDAPDEGYWELYTDSDKLDIILPPVYSDRDGAPTLPYSQAYELWSGGGCLRRCDGITDSISGKPCLCNPADRECDIQTRLNVMLPKIPGLGVWTLVSKGWNAATMLPATLDLLMHAASERQFIPAQLRLEQRTSKADGTTRKFVVPVIDLPEFRLEDALGSGGSLAINGPSARPPRPELPPVVEAPKATKNSEVEWPQPPPLPSQTEGAVAPATAVSADRAGTDEPEPESGTLSITSAQKKHLNTLVGKLRDAGHITTEQLWRACSPDNHASAWPRDENGELHWAPLRDSLTRPEASHLIERLMRLEENVEAKGESQFKVPASVQESLDA